MRKLFAILWLVPVMAWSQPPTTQPRPLGYDANGNVTPTVVNGRTLGLIAAGKTVYVDSVHGLDATGARARKDLPFLTLTAAKAAAVSGDTANIGAGTYTPTATVAKNGVNWILDPGATIQSTEGSTNVLSDGGSAMTFQVAGRGRLLINHASDEGAFAVYLGSASSVAKIEVDEIYGNGLGLVYSNGSLNLKARNIQGTGPTGGGGAVDLAGGTNNIEADTMVSANSFVFALSGGTNNIKVGRISAPGGGTEGFNVSGGTNIVDVRYVDAGLGEAVSAQGGTIVIYNATLTTASTTGTIRLAGIVAGTVELVNCHIISTHATMTPINFASSPLNQTLILRNCQITAAAGATYSITSDNAQTVTIVGSFKTNKPVHANITFSYADTKIGGDGSALTALNATNIASGTVAAARLGSGTANSTTLLRGDGVWANGLTLYDNAGTPKVALNLSTRVAYAADGITPAFDWSAAGAIVYGPGESIVMLEPGSTGGGIQLLDDDANEVFIVNPVTGSISQKAGGYHNFSVTAGTSGYGIRDSGGTMQFKNSGGSWTAVGGASFSDSAGLRGILGDENGTGVAIFNLASDPVFLRPDGSSSLAVVVTKEDNFYTSAADATLTLSGTPADGQWFGLVRTNSSGSAVTDTLPAGTWNSMARGSVDINTMVIPANSTISWLAKRVSADVYRLYGEPLTVNDTTTATAAAGDFDYGFDTSAGVDAKFARLIVGTNVQAYDADLTTLGAGGAGARTFLGLGTAAVLDTGTGANKVVATDGSNVATITGTLEFGDLVLSGVPAYGVDVSGNATFLSFTGSGSGLTSIPPAAVTGTAAVLGTNTFTGAQINSTAGATSAPALALSGVPFAGTGTTSFPLLYINDSLATASSTLNTAGTYFGINIDGTQDGINVLKDGVSVFKVSSGGVVTATGNLQASDIIVGTNRHLYLSPALDAELNREGAAIVQLGVDSTSTIAYTLKTGDRITSDGVGANLTIAGGRNRGASVGGSLIFQTSPAAAATVTGTLTTALTIDSTQTSIFAGVIRLKSFTVATLPAGTEGDTAYVTDATAPTYLGALTGGGAVKCPVFYNGAAWVSH